MTENPHTQASFSHKMIASCWKGFFFFKESHNKYSEGFRQKKKAKRKAVVTGVLG